MDAAVKIRTRIALVFAFAATTLMGCGNSSNYQTPTEPGPVNSPSPPSSANVVIAINGITGNMSFAPATTAVRVGQTVAWHNADSIAHAIAQDGGGFSTGTIPAGATSAPITISATGALPYHCTIHPSMTGTLTGQ
jgi:plastocyanin